MFSLLLAVALVAAVSLTLAQTFPGLKPAQKAERSWSGEFVPNRPEWQKSRADGNPSARRAKKTLHHAIQQAKAKGRMLVAVRAKSQADADLYLKRMKTRSMRLVLEQADLYLAPDLPVDWQLYDASGAPVRKSD